MKLAWRELVRRPSRFVTAGAALTLLVLLLLVLGGILDALVGSATGVLRAQTAPLIVYSADSKGSIDRSRISAAQHQAIANVPGVHEATGLGVALLAGHIEGRTEPADVAVFGYEAPNAKVPAPPPPGQAYADASLKDTGLELGQTLELGTARTPVTVIGWVNGTNYNLQDGVWVEPGTWRKALNANIPDAALVPGTFQVILVTPQEGSTVPDVATAIETQVAGSRR